MKKLKNLKGIHDIFVDSMNELDGKFQVQLKKTKQEYQKNIIDEKIQLLINVCNGEGLDFDKIKTKYLKPKELSQITTNDTVIENAQIIEEDLLDKIEINGQEYYYEAKEKGVIYDIDLNQVGIYKNGEFCFN
jgi:hypothetical protein